MADALELAQFGGADLVDEPPERLLEKALRRDAGSLPAFQALAALHLGVHVEERRMQLVATCPEAPGPGCQCEDTRAGPRRISAAARSAAWPLVDGAAIRRGERPELDRLADCVVRSLGADSDASGSAVELAKLVTPTETVRFDAVRSAGRRCERVLRKAGKRYAAALPLVRAVDDPLMATPQWLVSHRDETWVLPRLSKIASGRLGRQVRRCVDAVQAPSLVNEEP